MRSVQRIVLVIFGVVGLLTWTACSQAASPPTTPAERPGAATAPTPKRGGSVILNVGTNKPPTFDPLLDFRSGLASGPGIVYSSLVRSKGGPDLPPGGSRIVCDLCESWEQTDSVTYIFRLRKGVIFSKSIGNPDSDFPGVNGREVTAEDVVFSIKGMLDPQAANRHLVADVKSTEAVDRYTVKVVLADPNADFVAGIATVAAPVVAQEIAAAKGHFKEGPSIGSGPWVLKSGDRATGFSYVRNPDYYIKGADGKPLPYLDEVHQVPFLDAAASLAAFRTGKLLWLGLSKSEYDTISKEHPDWKYEFVKGTTSGYVLHLNKNIAPFRDNEDLRKAIFYAYNPSEITQAALDGLGYFFGGFSWSVEWAEELEPQMKQYVANLEKAKEHLAKSGVKPPITLELTVANYGPTHLASAQILQDQLTRIGINTTLKIIDQATYQATHNRGQWDFQIGWGPNGTNGVNPWYGLHALSGGLRAKASGINEAELDRMIREQWGEKDSEKRKAMNFKIAHYMAGKAIWDPAISRIDITASRPEIHDRYNVSVGYESRDLLDAWIE